MKGDCQALSTAAFISSLHWRSLRVTPHQPYVREIHSHKDECLSAINIWLQAESLVTSLIFLEGVEMLE